MQVSVTFRHMDATDALKTFASEKVSRVEKYIHTPTDAHVVLSVERGHMHKAEINVSANGLRIRGEETTGDMYSSIDAAAAKIEKQLKRYRTRLATHKVRDGHVAKARLSVVEHPDHSELPSEIPTQIVETREVDAHPMLVEEAIMQMDLMHSDFLVFINAKSSEVNVIYRRKEGNYGLIEPPHAVAKATA